MVRTSQNKHAFREELKCRVEAFKRTLRIALQRVDPPDEFVDRVQALVAQKEERAGARRASTTRLLKTLCISMIYLTCLATARGQAHQLIRGTVTAVSNGFLTVKADAGGMVQVQPDPATTIQKLAGGSMELKSAVAATFDDISVGDRVLISANAPDSGPVIARLVIVMKAADIGKKQAAEQADWQERGVGGLVRSINPVANTVTISVVGVAGNTTVTIQVTDKTQLMRYAPDSVKFSDAKPGPLAMIQVGDQLKARGNKSSDGVTITADEIVTGSFRNISGEIIKVDIPNNTLTVKVVATKATVMVALTSNTDMHALPLAVATRFAVRFKGGSGATPAGGPGGGQDEVRKSVSSDLTQIISSTPRLTLAQLEPGAAVMIAATASTNPNSVTAITLLSGVEPILTAAPADNTMTLAPWSLSSGNPN
jgi:Domain of unknown function (DUF5666)